MGRQVLCLFARIEVPAAWALMIGGLITFVGVAVGFIVVGEARPATLLISADLFVSGFSAVGQAYDNDDQGS